MIKFTYEQVTAFQVSIHKELNGYPVSKNPCLAGDGWGLEVSGSVSMREEERAAAMAIVTKFQVPVTPMKYCSALRADGLVPTS